MKLKNKKTGEIGYLRSTNWNEISLIIMDTNGTQLAKYNSLAELNEEWEDYEEPKEYWAIGGNGEVYKIFLKFVNSKYRDEERTIGNYFETKEEAEQAVEKLRAWKRLKDKGFRFTGFTRHGDEIALRAVLHDDGVIGMITDLDLLFSGGEE